MPERHNTPKIFNELLPTFNTEAGSSSEGLEIKGAHPHFTGMEIEAKLQIIESPVSSEQILKTLKKRLEGNGYIFTDSEMIVRDNYSIYYKKRDDKKGKIIAKDRGAGGFQVKYKSAALKNSFNNIIIKNEGRSEIFNSLEAAEDYLSSKLGLQEARKHVESIIQIKKYKLTIAALGDDSVTRFFRLVVDESEIPNENSAAHSVANLFRQIELEYKGSDRQEPDNLKAIKLEIDKIIKIIISETSIQTKKTSYTKRKWALSNKNKNSEVDI